jgi:tol-pal system protein YbgF
MTQLKRHLTALTISLFAGSVTPAHAGLFDDNEARKAILDIRTQLDATIKTVEQQQNRITELNQELSKLRGQNEQLQNTVNTLTAQQDSGFESINARLIKLEPMNPEQLAQFEFDEALAFIQNSNYAAAYKAFDKYAKKYPASEQQALVEFWRATAAYGTRNYTAAIAGFGRFLKQNPSHEKRPDALLTLGSAQIETGKKPEGQATLKQLISEFPNSDAAKTAAKVLSGS